LEVNRLSLNKAWRTFLKSGSASIIFSMHILNLAAQYVESPSLARDQIGPLVFSPNSWDFHASSTVYIHLARLSAFSVLSDGDATTGIGE
jgi:hypothetical protein